jgi:hypothetical protein
LGKINGQLCGALFPDVASAYEHVKEMSHDPVPATDQRPKRLNLFEFIAPEQSPFGAGFTLIPSES